ncbi:chloride channel protein [Sediminibacterium sp.]|uniref:chloride channel protein n=1 Tax=Sediminibacterium sp. TaxID=1917865 RepID=UPI0025D313CE|nr:chloride channel protein [Sediminibacterium sp.]
MIYIRSFAKWMVICILIAILAGSGSALFLVLLDYCTQIRMQQRFLIALLPIAGLITALIYQTVGKPSSLGNQLIVENILQPSKPVLPFLMAPFIFATTLLSHLFGASAGREGTALQISTGLSDQLTKPFNLSDNERALLLLAAVAAGFGSVFGTPIAGAIFALEFATNKKAVSLYSILLVFVCAFLAHWVCLAWGVVHTEYLIKQLPKISFINLLFIVLVSIIFGLVAFAFKTGLHYFKVKASTYLPNELWRSVIGGAFIALIVYITNGFDFIGLGIESMVRAFDTPAHQYDFAIKMFLTILTLSVGFKGGEVTPLFFIGATLGSGLSLVLPLPISFLAGMGMVSVFGASAKTPLAAALLALELFGKEYFIYSFAICIIASFIAGKKSIYQPL